MTTNDTDQPLSITPAREWNNARGELYRLPGSGNIARLRRPSLSAMAARVGQIPNPLTAEVMRFLAVVDTTTRPTPEQQIESYCKNVLAYLHIAQLVFVEPRFVLKDDPNYDAGEIGPHDLTDADYVWIWSKLIYGEAGELRPFRVNSGAA